MFKGITEDIGTIISIDRVQNCDTRVFIKPYNISFLSKIQLGSSVACSGICLSIVQLHNEYFSSDISEATLSATNIIHWKEGTKINFGITIKNQ